jgi:hypothetical protein
MTSHKLLKQALEALENINQKNYAWVGTEAANAIREHLAKPEPEPVAQIINVAQDYDIRWVDGNAHLPDGTLLYRKEDV